MKKIFVVLLLVCIVTLTACGGSDTKESDYTGVYKNDDSSEVVIRKEDADYRVNITIYRLAAFYDCFVEDIKDNVLYLRTTDPNGKQINFTFDYKTKTLTVTKTSWELLNENDKFVFDK